MNLQDCQWLIKYSQCLLTGDRNYMEDFCYTNIVKNGCEALFGIFGIFDGHGGADAARFVKETIKNELLNLDLFWSNDSADVKESIKVAYFKLQKLMWIERENWNKTFSGYKSTSGTTASIVIIRNGIVYTGHVGDSGTLLLYSDKDNVLRTEELTKEHKPDDPTERNRIERSGGSLVKKDRIDRVVWYRPKLGHNSHEIERIPFLAVARSLGDLWSYDKQTDCYHISPEPDVNHFHLNNNHRALIVASDGLWNIVDKQTTVNIINLCLFLNKDNNVYSPAQILVEYCLYLWHKKNLKSDNISAIVIFLKPQHLEESSVIIESLDDNLQELYSELLSKNLLYPSMYQPPPVSLGYTENFRKHCDDYRSPDVTDGELLAQYLHANERFSVSTNQWRDSMHYWNVFFNSLTNLGCKSLPQVISKLEALTKQKVDEMMASVPWTIFCQQYLSEMHLADITKSYISAQPTLTHFWTKFMHKIMPKSFDPFAACPDGNIARSVLFDKCNDIENWISSLIGARSNSPVKYTLKKSNTCSELDLVKIPQCFPIEKSNSLKMTKSLFPYAFQSSLSSLSKTGSTRSNISTDYDQVLDDTPNTTPQISPVKTKEIVDTYKERPVPYTLKRNYTVNILEPKDEQQSEPSKKYCLTRQKRVFL